MTKKDLENKIIELENALFYESMADFINWSWYRATQKLIDELKKELEKVESE